MKGCSRNFCHRRYVNALSFFFLLKHLYYPATGFSESFPGIKPHLLTLTNNFKVPFYRDILMALGIYSVSKASCSNILKAGPGSSITIVVGGAAESLSAHPGTVNLTLRKRYVCLLVDWIRGLHGELRL